MKYSTGMQNLNMSEKQKKVILYTVVFFSGAKKCKDSDHKRIDIDWASVEEKWSQPEEREKLEALEEDEETYRNTVYNHECWNRMGRGRGERRMQMAVGRQRRHS